MLFLLPTATAFSKSGMSNWPFCHNITLSFVGPQLPMGLLQNAHFWVNLSVVLCLICPWSGNPASLEATNTAANPPFCHRSAMSPPGKRWHARAAALFTLKTNLSNSPKQSRKYRQWQKPHGGSLLPLGVCPPPSPP